MTITAHALKRMCSGLAAGITLASIAPTAFAQLSFALSYDPAIDPLALAGFQAAAARWSSALNDPITISLSISFRALGAGIIGSTGSSTGTVSYNSYKSALTLDRSSTNDTTAVASLQSGSSFNLLLNRTSNSPSGSGSATPYVDSDGDANNSTVRINLANARALGLYQSSGGLTDASITFSSAFAFDFDPSDGITPGLIDFVGVATHEMGHALGFTSGVDTLDTRTTPLADDALTFVRPLDLFRYSDASVAAGVIDWTADARDKYFSIDGGDTALGLFSTGTVFGDGRQASHWKDNLGIGIMDPTAARGELLSISALDLEALDVIGYNLVPVPEPSTIGLAGVGVLCMAIVFRRRRAVSKG